MDLAMSDLLLSEIFPPRTGGSGRWFWEIYRRLPREEYVIAAGEGPGADAFDRTHDLRIRRLPLTLPAWGLRSLRGLGGYLGALRGLWPLLGTERVRRIHCARCLPEGVMGLALKVCRRVPYLCYVHGEDVSTAANSREHAWLTRRVLAGAAFLIANSRNTAGMLSQEWSVPAERIRIMHPGVDTNYFTPIQNDRDVRARLGWSDRAVLLTVGRLQKRKGQDMMIRALNTIRRTVPNVLYAILGDGEERANLLALAHSEDVTRHVEFLGEATDTQLLDCYRACDLFALPNRQEGKDIEGFGMVLLEAQACGKPVIAGASGGTAETMNIPHTGRVVNCDGPQQLADLVVELLADRPVRERMGKAAREWVVSRFDWSALSRQAEQVFRGKW
jgi:phosphatidyl-myo-inositol dimannoside synthase